MEKNSPLTLCMILEEDYLPGALVTLRSLHHHNDVASLPLLIWTPIRMSNQACEKLLSVHRNTRFELIDHSRYRGCLFNEHRLWGVSPAARYELFRWPGQGQLLYLDADLLVMGDVSDILNYRGPFAACPMPPGEGMEFKHMTGFNGGILSLDATHRNQSTWSRIVALAESRPWSGNQTVLNLQFAANFDKLDMRFNMPVSHITDENFDSISIIHFVGNKKPWDTDAQFGEHQMRMAGPNMCARLLKTWHRYADR